MAEAANSSTIDRNVVSSGMLGASEDGFDFVEAAFADFVVVIETEVSGRLSLYRLSHQVSHVITVVQEIRIRTDSERHRRESKLDASIPTPS